METSGENSTELYSRRKLLSRKGLVAIGIKKGYNLDMEKRIYNKEDFNTGKWSGGNTTEYAIFPTSAQYLERDFIWRLSSAQVDDEESSFTKLPDYDRVLMVLEGEAILVHGDQRTVKLGVMEQDSFDGAVKTRCFGKIKDYNLMVRKGCCGRLWYVEAENGAKAVERGAQGEFQNGSYGFFCQSGYAVISVGEETCMVKEGQQLVLDFDIEECSDMMIMGDGKIIVSEIFYSRQAHVAEEIPEEKATFDDFKTAFKLAHSRNKWKQAMGKDREEGVWYDEALRQKLDFLDKSYIGMIIWAVVTLLLILLALTDLSHMTIIAMIIAWSVLYALAVSPLIYMMALPKPIKAHIKRVDSLTEYERKLYEQEKGKNPELEKIFKKYKHSGEKGWDVEDYESIFTRMKK